MNLIYMCVFHQVSYINLLKLLITSISSRGNIDRKTTDILIITSSSFQQIIQKELESFDLPIHYYLLDLKTMMEASCCKLKIFSYDQIDKYEKILYLDTDVLINSDVNILFNNKIHSDKIYALTEGNIGDELWGGEAFFDFNFFDRNSEAFSAGVFYFINSPSIKKLFEDTNLHIKKYLSEGKQPPICLDQPFLVYNSFIKDKYDNKFMIKYLENNPTILNKEKIIYHFPGGVGHYTSKIIKMTEFWNKINSEKNYTELCYLGKKYMVDKSPFFINHTYTPEYHRLFKELRNNVENILEIGIGNIPLMKGLTNDLYKPGASLRMWKDYFQNANIYGCDILDNVLFNEERITTYKVDQSCELSLNNLISQLKNNMDIIIDDGSHIQEHMVTSFKTLWKIVKPNGLYIIEDIQSHFFDRINKLNYELNFTDANCILAYRGKNNWDNFVVFKKI